MTINIHYPLKPVPSTLPIDLNINSTSPALKITQTGTGPALLVEDQASDTSPFIIDSDGVVLKGLTTKRINTIIGNSAVLQLEGSSTSDKNIASIGRGADGTLVLARQNGTNSGDNTIVSAGNELGAIYFGGADGTGLFTAARIRSFVDGTPGVGSMPGLLRFDTTPSGSTLSIERMRINSSGNVGIGTGGSVATTLAVGKNITGSTICTGISSTATIQSDVVSETQMFVSSPSTQAASFTLTNLIHYFATQGTFGVGSEVDTQYGFHVRNNLIGANNNFGFFSNINALNVTAGSFVNSKQYKITSIGTTDFTLIGASSNTIGVSFVATGAGTGNGTADLVGRWNFVANGSAENLFNGNTIINVFSGLPALRITQSGFGDCLLVEDSSNPDTTPFVIDGNGCVVIGATAASSSVESSNYSLQQIGISAATTGHLQLNSSPNAASAGGVYQARSRSGAIVVDGDRLGQWQNYGYDGTSYIPAARILAEVDGTPGTNDMPGRITFSTTADGASAVTERLRIDSAGNINAKTSVGATIPLISGVTIEDVVTVEPTLDIDFSNPSGIPGSLTFARNLAAKYYDGKTTAKAEENLVFRSQEFDNAVWNKTNTTATANSTTAPDGTVTADLLAETAATGSHAVGSTSSNYTTFQSGQTYVFSIFAKKGPGATAPDIIQLTFNGSGFGTNVYANYNLNTGAVTAFGAGVTSTSMASLGSGWYRCIMIANATSTNVGSISINFVNNNSTATRAPSYTGATTSDVYLWGAQLEQRSSITDYVVTTTQPIQNYMPILVDAPVNTPRIDFDPITLEVKGLLIEEARTNVLTYSEDFADASWGKSNSSISSNVVIAPDGSLTADKLVEDTSNTSHYVGQTYTTTAGSNTFSVYAKAAGQTKIILAVTADQFGVGFDLTTGQTFSQTYATNQGTGKIEAVGNNWYRCSMTWAATNVTNGMRIVLSVPSGQVYTGDGYSGVYLWGAQLEIGAFVTSYIKTTTIAVTRPADQASLTGTNFSDWYRQDQGTIYASSRRFAAVDFAKIVSFTDGTVNNVIALGHGSGANPLRLDVSYASVSQASITAVAAPSLNTVYNLIGSYNINNMTVSANGLTVSTDTAAIVPTVNRVNIGSYITNVYYFNGYIRRVIYWPKQLSNETMRTISAITL